MEEGADAEEYRHRILILSRSKSIPEECLQASIYKDISINVEFRDIKNQSFVMSYSLGEKR
jgi:hypothetical protein